MNTYGINLTTNKLHRNKLGFTWEFIGNFQGKIGKLLTTKKQSAMNPTWPRERTTNAIYLTPSKLG
jgi:hypothetical protein